MNSTEIFLEGDGIRQLLRSDEVIECLNEHADNIIGRCEGNYQKSEYVGRNRANVSIYTDDEHTYWKNIHTNELINALGKSK